MEKSNPPPPPAAIPPPVNQALALSFTLTHYILLFAFVICFFSFLSVSSSKMRQILYLECGITFIASSIYIIFSKSIVDNHSAGDVLNTLFGFSLADPLQNINVLRYVGWTITTALMLCVLCLVLALNLKTTAPGKVLATVVGLDWLMLAFGFAGETGVLDKMLAMILGFVPFFAMFYVVYDTFLAGKKNARNVFIYWLYFVLWILYGLVYLADPIIKTISTNVLDCIAKAFFAIGLSLSFLME